jgi:hypothetical protein
MPAGDSTGPLGRGPMTGRGAGRCAGYDVPGFANFAPGRGLGLGWGRGRGWGVGRDRDWARGRRWRHWYHATGLPGWSRYGHAPAWGVPPVGPYAAAPSPEQEVEMLRGQAEWLQGELDAIARRIEELEQE